jgi:pilus assembly protein CpaF
MDALYENNRIREQQTRITAEVRKRFHEQSETEISDEQARRIIENAVMDLSSPGTADFRRKKMLADAVFNVTRKELDILQPLAEDDEVNEIMVNGPDSIFIERSGRLEQVPLHFDNREHLEELIRRIAAGVHREINDIQPIVDARLEDGSRVNAVYSNVAVNGPILTIRKFPKKTRSMEDLIFLGSLTREAADFLKLMVETGHNIFISGGTSSGKTTFLNTLSEYIPKNERVVVIEDSYELQMDGIGNLVRLETRNANSQGKGAVNIRQLIRTAMRMRPDRIIVGEVRGAEALDMLQALNSGHEGCMSTGHSNSAKAMMYRLETMVLTAESFPLDAIRQQIISAIDLVVHLGRFPDLSRKVIEISEVTDGGGGTIQMNPIFLLGPEGLARTDNPMMNDDKLRLRKWGEASGIS